ncbi:MAG TPA: SH3 domain-containing protein [Bacteroidia bacterium]|nr:SH3 domain-containing protein [Bacteroidia bacterium]
MKNVFKFWILLITFPVFSQQDSGLLAVISDTNQFVLLRSGAGKENPVIDTLHEGYMFSVYGDTSKPWLDVHTPVGIAGSVHRSQVRYFDQLDYGNQKALLLDCFHSTRIFYKDYWTRVEAAESLQKRQKLYKDANNIYEAKFIPAYTALAKLISVQPDSTLLIEFYKSLPYVSGSADEGKEWACAQIWLCQTTYVESLLCNLVVSLRITVINSIKTGMAMSGFEEKFSKDDLQNKYNRLDNPCGN